MMPLDQGDFTEYKKSQVLIPTYLNDAFGRKQDESETFRRSLNSYLLE